MKAQDPRIIDFLNDILKNELTAINQYFLHAKMLEDWGFEKLAKKERQESIEEMQHADELIDRILRINGLPNLQNMGKLLVGEDVPEIIACDLEQEMIAIPILREAAAFCEEQKDFVSGDLVQKILLNEEEHVIWLETQESMINDLGVQNYLQIQSSESGG